MASYEYVGDAEAVAEGADIPIAKLSQDSVKVKVAKIGKAVEFSDEALLSGYDNDIAEEAAKQVVVAINSKLEADLIAKMSTDSTLTGSIDLTAGNVTHSIAEALTAFGEDMEGEKVLLVSPAVYTSLLKSDAWIPGTEAGANVIMPNLSPATVREKYKLYDNKICTGDEAAEAKQNLADRMASIGYEIVTARGDVHPH